MVTKILDFSNKHELKNVPFQILHEKVTLAGRRAVESLMKNETDAYERMITRKEKEWTGTHEAPSEGNLREDYPFVGPSPEVVREEKAKAEQTEFKEMCAYLKLKEKALWLLPQVTAYIAKMKLPINSKCFVDHMAFLRENFQKDDWHLGLYRYCTAYQRGLIVPNQYSETYKNYSALVPLLMMPFKKFDGVPYMDWYPNQASMIPPDEMEHILDPQLYLALCITYMAQEFTEDEILEVRNVGLRVKTGEKKDTMRNPIASHKLYGIQDYELDSYPWLVQVMTTQIWAAHPSIRTNLMVLDSVYWDNIPTPLISAEVFSKPVTEVGNKVIANDLSWMA